MAELKRAIIMAAGEGSRLKELSPFKPMISILGKPLVERVMERLLKCQFEEMIVAFNTSEKKMDFAKLPSFKNPKIKTIFVDTPSSMHTLYELLKILRPHKEELVFASMVDTIITEKDFETYIENLRSLPLFESSLLVTTYIEDEKPLTLKIDSNGNVRSFNCPIEKGTLVTSGMYALSGTIFPELEKEIQKGTMKMRNFLSHAVEKNYVFKTFVVKKTLDIDRPEDVKSAEEFLCQS